MVIFTEYVIYVNICGFILLKWIDRYIFQKVLISNTVNINITNPSKQMIFEILNNYLMFKGIFTQKRLDSTVSALIDEFNSFNGITDMIAIICILLFSVFLFYFFFLCILPTF